MKTLLLDDDPFLLRFLSAQLEDAGAEVRTTCERADEALDILRGEDASIDVVFCDLQMPGVDGIEFIRELACIPSPPALVLVSGEETRVLQSAERLARAHKLLVLGVLHKPFQVSRVRQIVELHQELARNPTVRGLRLAYPVEDLREGIASGELVNHYQPKIELAGARLVGVEALVRWQHSRDGLVFPDCFIPIAEQSSLIDDLVRNVLSAALVQLRKWLDAGLELHMAVNVSMANLVDLDFPDYLVKQAAAVGVPVSALVLEITESRLMGDARATLDILTRLRLKRIGLSIDDFGTGHSSLAQLRDLPFNELKVDRGFVHGVAMDSALQAILESSLSLSRQLEMRSVAEGVENREDWDYVAASGCTMAQGYFIGKPMDADQFEKWIPDWERRRGALWPVA